MARHVASGDGEQKSNGAPQQRAEARKRRSSAGRTGADILAASKTQTYPDKGKAYGEHPIASLFPVVTGKAFDDLVRRVKENGVIDPVIVWKGKILVGRDELRAASKAKVDVRIEEKPPTMDFVEVIRLNLQRYRLTPSQRAMIARDLRELSTYMNLGDPWAAATGASSGPEPYATWKALTQDEAAKAIGSSRTSVQRANRISETAPVLANAVREGTLAGLRDAVSPEVLGADAEICKEALDDLKEGRERSIKTAVEKQQKARGIQPKKKKAPAKPRSKPGSGLVDDDMDAEVYSPPLLISVARTVLGAIDLDPASSDDAQMAVQASEYYTPEQDGTSLPWKARVYCFPPPNAVSSFAGKLSDELAAKNVKSAFFVAPSETGVEWAQKLLALPQLTAVVHRRRAEGLLRAPTKAGGKPSTWHPPLGLTSYVYGVVPTKEFVDALLPWGFVFTCAGRAARV